MLPAGTQRGRVGSIASYKHTGRSSSVTENAFRSQLPCEAPVNRGAGDEGGRRSDLSEDSRRAAEASEGSRSLVGPERPSDVGCPAEGQADARLGPPLPPRPQTASRRSRLNGGRSGSQALEGGS